MQKLRCHVFKIINFGDNLVTTCITIFNSDNLKRVLISFFTKQEKRKYVNEKSCRQTSIHTTPFSQSYS